MNHPFSMNDDNIMTEVTPPANSESETNPAEFREPPPPQSDAVFQNTDDIKQDSANGSRPTKEIKISEISLIPPTLDYTPPPWAVEPPSDANYGVEVIKGGVILEIISFSKREAATHIVIGRLPSCDIQLDHPSISRFHCVLQYGEDLMDRKGKGWYMFDLGSTHGSVLNKKKIPSKQYIRIRVGHVMKFGGSTRIMTLVGPSSDTESEWDCSPTEMKKKIERKRLEEKLQREAEKEMEMEKEKDANNEGISWGMNYDEEGAYAHASELNNSEDREAKYRDDPLKVLSRFFDREGFDMEFTFSETGSGFAHKWTCSIELPVDTAAGHSLSATATCSGSKKDAQALCSLNACRVLDMHGVLFRSANEARKKERNLEKNDFYDSDEDTYLDRTGQIEKSRENRKRRVMEARGESTTVKETYEGLLKKIAAVAEQMADIEKRLTKLSHKVELKKVEGEDELDSFCRQLMNSESATDDAATKVEKSHLRQRLVELKHEKERMEILAKIAKPVALPELKPVSSKANYSDGAKRSSGEVSGLTMQKLMMMRRARAQAAREKEECSREKEQPAVSNSRESDEKPFIAEVEEDDEDSLTGSASVQASIDAAAQSTANVPVAPIVETIKGPAMTDGKLELLNEEELLVQTEASEESVEPCTSSVESSHEAVKRKRIRVRGERSSAKSEEIGEYGEGSAHRDEEYATWMPPENQSGDGSTSLNAKFAGRY